MSECLVMAKPVGPLCNLRCGYCYYVGKTHLLEPAHAVMTHELLKTFIVQRLSASPGPCTHFEWHGGDPTLAGLDLFRAVVRIQRALCPPGRKITNGLQTNGVLLDGAWVEFLAREGFSVGLSLDGPAHMHDPYRRTAGGRPTHDQVIRAFHMLKKGGVFCNVLCVLHLLNAEAPDEVYDFFRSLGVSWLQFLPLVAPAKGGGVSPETAAPETIGYFLCRVFDRWIEEDVGRIVIQTFDEALRPLYGIPHSLCVHRETCGDVAVLERDGGFYACDHYVDPAHLVGNIREHSIGELAADPRMIDFGLVKRDALPEFCRECGVLSSCNGGCPKDRIATAPDGEHGLNYLCAAYRKFFTHSRPGLGRLAAHMKAGKPLRAFIAPR
ncbi:MAG: anaerobic sulfatase maturase [Spirochaetia bacterium]|jgi:uncharacterized protein